MLETHSMPLQAENEHFSHLICCRTELQNDPRLGEFQCQSNQPFFPKENVHILTAFFSSLPKAQTGPINVSFSSSTAAATCFHQVLPWKTPIAVWKYCILYQQSAINIASPTYNISFLKAAKCKAPLPFPLNFSSILQWERSAVSFFMNKQTFGIRRLS